MITPDELRTIDLFAVLPPTLLARLASRSADIRANAGEYFVREGDVAYFWAVLEGEVEALKMIGGSEQAVTTFDAGEFFGDVPLMLSMPAFSAVRAIKPSRLARLDAADFHSMLTESPEAGVKLGESLARRVNFIRDAFANAQQIQARIVGDRYDFQCHDLRDFLARNQISFEWLDPSDPGDAACIPAATIKEARYPVVILPDKEAGDKVLYAPSLRELAEGLGLTTKPEEGEPFDVVIVGGGPAGLAAAVYGGSEGLRTMMVEREAPGGQAGTSSRIENYLGFPGGISGGDLANRALMQAKRFGTQVVVTRSVESVEMKPDGNFVVHLDGSDSVETRTVVVAIGVTWRRLEAEGAERLEGRGVYYGAARTEALGTLDKDVFLIGGGNSAGQAAMFFSSYARSVTLLVRGPSIEKSMSYYLIEQLRTKQNITVETRTTVVSVAGDAHIESIVTRDERTGATTTRKADGLFSFIGADADTAWLGPDLERDERGYLKTGRDVAQGWKRTDRLPYSLETSVPGIFAVGDVRSTSIKRVASGVGEGSVVIAFVHQYLESLRTPAPA